MKTNCILSEYDASDLHSELNRSDSLPKLLPDQRDALRSLLETSPATADDAIMETRVALHDKVTLVCRNDPTDWYQMEIVLPHQADLDADRIPVVHPMCLAALGRCLGDEVSWDTTHGIRTMKITRIQKEAVVAV